MSNLEIVAAISGASVVVLGLAASALGEVGDLLGLGAFSTVSVSARVNPRLGAARQGRQGLSR